jgi:hypothetical protein
MTTPTITDPFCAVEALNAAEPLFGTATAETTVWFLLEYNAPWSYAAVEDNGLPVHVQQWFENHLAAIPQSRLLFIKKDKRQTQTALHFYLAITRENEQRLYAFQVENHEEIMWLDLAAAVAGKAEYDKYLTKQTLFLICTNGKRDKCCSKFGIPLYQSMNAAYTNTTANPVWQTTHIGGHRYSPTLAVFPQGLFYGQVTLTAAEKLMTLSEQNEIVLDFYRGRTCYTEVQQAADYYVRQQTGCLALDVFQFQQTTQVGDTWQVVFLEKENGRTHTLTIRMTFSEPVLASCTKMKLKSRPLYQLLSYDTA